MAGNIIPAIATTNAIVAGMMVMLAFKILNKRIADCKTVRVYFVRIKSITRSRLMIANTNCRPFCL
jgi:ubiquitin-like 1-activating enzyme E1 B